MSYWDVWIIMGITKNTLIAHVHIPKCAGTSVTRTLLNDYKPYFEIHYQQQDVYFKQFLDDLPRKRYRFVFGHFWHRQIDWLREAQIDHFALSFIRHPVERIISHYRFDRTALVPWHEEFINRVRCFEEYCFSFRSNFMCNHLVGGAKGLDEYINKVEERYHFIGVKERFRESMSVLYAHLGKQYHPIDPQNVTQANSYNQEGIKQETRERLEEIHALDLAFWNHKKKQYDATGN